jgi:hypothetical protein
MSKYLANYRGFRQELVRHESSAAAKPKLIEKYSPKGKDKGELKPKLSLAKPKLRRQERAGFVNSLSDDLLSGEQVLSEEIDEDGNKILTARKTSGRTTVAKGREKTWCSVTGKPPMLLGRALQTIEVVMEMPPSTAVQIAGAEVQFNNQVQYAFLTGGADWLSVFDAYRIKLMQMTIRPTYTVAVVGMVKMPNVYTVIDYDDSAGVSGAVLQQYSNCTITGGETIVRTIHPHCEIDMGGAGTGNVESPWCDATSVNIPHFGFKAVVDPGAGGQTVFQEFSVFIRCLVEFRTTR